MGWRIGDQPEIVVALKFIVLNFFERLERSLVVCAVEASVFRG